MLTLYIIVQYDAGLTVAEYRGVEWTCPIVSQFRIDTGHKCSSVRRAHP